MTARGDWREGLPDGVDAASLPVAVQAVRHDSREVQRGDCFVCISGERADGHAYAAAAASAGAAVVVAQRGRGEALSGIGATVVEVPDTRIALASIAAAHEDFPARRLAVIGVTGTDGKTTTAFLTLAAIEAAGARSGLLTTVEARIAGERRRNPSRLTTQEAPVVQGLLAEMVEAGCTHAVVEATSHGLDLHRLDGCEFDVAVLTNLSEDHLDFHGTMDRYRRAKGRLFAMLDEPTAKSTSRVAVLNGDDAAWPYFASRTQAARLTYGRSAEADLRIDDEQPWPDGSTFVLSGEFGEMEASVPLPGRFNVSNAAAAIAAATAAGLNLDLAARGVATCDGVPGRMQRIAGAPFTVIVDYAHTPEALRQVLSGLQEIAEGRVIVVFGAAGERSRDRRSGLGRVAAQHAHYVVLTEEDPRSEHPDAIIEEIATAMLAAGGSEGGTFERVPERAEAIARALGLARAGDIVLLAGKGHESTIERSSGSIPWDEAGVARTLIEERFGA